MKTVKETNNYKLKKPAETDYYAVEDQNGNMDAIDTALHGLEETKAPVSHAHAWNAITNKPNNFAPSAHAASHSTGGADAMTAAQVGARPNTWVPTATEVKTTSGESVETSLSKKVNNSFGDIGTVNILEWANQQKIGGSFCVNPNDGTAGVPKSGIWYNGSLEINRESVNLVGKTLKIVSINDNDNSLWENHLINNIWAGWTRFATATPPQEFNLPLVEGYTAMAVYKCSYSKAQDGTVLVHLAIKHTSGALPVGYQHAATLPVGFRPAGVVGYDLIAQEGVFTNPDGKIAYSLASERKSLICTLTFRATP